MADELSYWSDLEERVIGLVFRDRTDNDFGWILMARDKIGRFRAVHVEASLTEEAHATMGLRMRIARAVDEGDFLELGGQKDETNYPVDLLSVPPGTDPAKLHPYFKILLEDPGRAPARAVFREIGPWLAPTDPHFVREFQFNHFDQRLFELYLWAALRELGFDIEQPEAPDFLCNAPNIQFSVEATTVAASVSGPLADHPNPQTPEEMEQFLREYMPMKFGSCLTSKLNKKNKEGESYWQRGAATGRPFIIAIADFHDPAGPEKLGSMTYTQSALAPYLYGRRFSWEMIDGTLVVKATKNDTHSFRGKTIPSGFVDLPGAENISAVLFTNAGTMSKFSRLGILAGFTAPGHRYFRMGVKFDPAPNAVHGLPFSGEVGGEGYDEYWSDELQLFHNPNAKHPIPLGAFSGITQHFFENGNHYSFSPANVVLASYTMILKKPEK